MVGGEEDVLDRCRDILGAFGLRIFYVGWTHGNGHLAKPLNNPSSAATFASAAEAVLPGVRVGLDPGKLIEVVNASSGRSASTEVKFPRYVLSGTFDHGFGISLIKRTRR